MKNYKLSVNLESFLQEKNLNPFSVSLLKNDASSRQYYRVLSQKSKCLLMDSSLEKVSLKNYIKVTNWLRKNNFSAPELFESDIKKGLLLLEDFGENKFSILLRKDKNKKEFYYAKAIDLLGSLSRVTVPDFMKFYNNKTLFKELELYLIWHLNLEKKK